ncbi:MAG: protein-L-isoaspartate(D-aspartate) O-methyltransferase [Candidatus Rokubacteria bacterium]|nr:protein-L-isoaspartate(D-aspartate) O-methyltransferase [Candidatus Rokubacteria bacterium]
MATDGGAVLRRLPAAHARPGLVGVLALLLAGIADGAPATSADAFAVAREQMVRRQIVARGVRDARVLAALREVPRHRFVPSREERYAYEDRPLPIGDGQTISQPYIVALMTELARPAITDRVLEVGTGSGYQAAVLARLVSHVYTIELVTSLARAAAARLRELGYQNVTVQAGDGYLGWPEHAPFDIIMVTAAPDHVPSPLLEQLARGGRMIVPVGPAAAVQQLLVIEKDAAGELRTRAVTPVRFVPLLRPR